MPSRPSPANHAHNFCAPWAINKIPATTRSGKAHNCSLVFNTFSTVDVFIIAALLNLYVSNLQQKICAIEAGVGVGFLPIDQIGAQIKSGTLKTLTLAEPSVP